MKLTTTLALLRQNDACERGYNLIANHVGRDFTGQINLRTILDVNGKEDCLWALRATEQSEGLLVAVAFAIYCAEPYVADEAWRVWAWMNGSDRSQSAADAAWTASADAANASRASARAADAAWAAWAANESRASARAADAAWASARAVDDNPRQLAILRRLLSDDSDAGDENAAIEEWNTRTENNTNDTKELSDKLAAVERDRDVWKKAEIKLRKELEKLK